MPFENFIERCWKYGVSKFACRSRRVVSNTDDGIQAPTWEHRIHEANYFLHMCMHMENNNTLIVFFCSGADFCYIMNTSASTPIMVSVCHASTARQISILIRIITAFTNYFFRTTLVFQVCGRLRKLTTSCARSLSFIPHGLKLCQQTVRRLNCPGLNRLAICFVFVLRSTAISLGFTTFWVRFFAYVTVF